MTARRVFFQRSRFPYCVTMCTAEIGVRMAMGAQRGEVAWIILKDSLLVSATGVDRHTIVDGAGKSTGRRPCTE